jgi:hypothetical protein
MSTVVQSTCPGCKQPLRIPAEWLTQAVRCKQCGMVLHAKSTPTPASKSSGVRPAVSPRTPPPRPIPTVAPPAANAVAVAPLAGPVTAGGSPFDMLDADTAAVPSRPPRYRSKRGVWWIGPAVAASVVIVVGVVTVFAWPSIRQTLQAPVQGVARVEDKHETPPPDASKDKTPKTDEPNKDPKDAKGPAGKSNDPTKPPNDSTTTNPPIKTTNPATPPGPKGTSLYPRRALIISVNNYLYANPVHAGMSGASAHNIPNFLEALNKGLHIPMTEMAHLSDAAAKGLARAPMKPIIEKTLTDFLDSSRAQDRIMVFFIGHAVLIGDDTYLVPIEGEMDNADTLIPLKWVYEQMAKCKARQKVLVMDVNRFSPGHGLERPNGGPMDAKEAEALAKPPDGVQVWTACITGQQSYELDDAQEGAFLERLYVALAPNRKAGEKGLEGVIQNEDDLLPLEQLRDVVNAALKEEVTPYKLEQQTRLSGAPPQNGAKYDKMEALAPDAVKSLAAAPASGDMKEVQAVLDEIGVPPIKASNEDSSIRAAALPPFPADRMAPYSANGDMSDLRKAVLHAREVIWALNTMPPPAALGADVQKIRTGLKANLSILKDGYRKPGDENKFKDMVFKDEKEVADLMSLCDDALTELKTAGEKRAMETKRWQANYDFTLARLEGQYAYLWEYQSMLGQMRKQMPDLAPGQNGWQLAAQEALKGDSQGKNLAKASRKLLDQIAKDNPGTPWEVLAKREKLTALGLQWQGAKIE